MPSTTLPSLSFITGVSRLDVLQQHLARSPCVASKGKTLLACMNARSAAEAFNAAVMTARTDWLVWVHQDVYLPAGWDTQFALGLQQAQARWPQLAVAGVYGVRGHGDHAQHVGRVLDRGALLAPPVPLPCLADSLDELLVAVRVSSGLQMDPALGFDFYGTDLVLQAQAKGMSCAVVDAYCEHWSDTPNQWPLPAALTQRIEKNAAAFEKKWAPKLPITTTCFDIRQLGDVAAFLSSRGATIV
jgi:hypothetical protein